MKASKFPKSNKLRLVAEGFIVLPVFLFILVGISNGLRSAPYIKIPQVMYWFLLLLSIIAFLISKKFKNKLFAKGEIPADTSMLIGTLIMFPFILSFSLIGNSAYAFLTLEGAIIVASVLFAAVGTTFKPNDFPIRDNLAGFFLVAITIMITAVLSVLILANNLITLGFVVGYFSVFMLVQLAIYTVQLFAYRDKFNLNDIFN